MQNTTQKLISPKQAAAYLGNVSEGTLRNWAAAGKGPAHLKIGCRTRYDPAELDKFKATWRRVPVSEEARDGEPTRAQ